MRLLPTFAFLLLNAGSICSATDFANSSLEGGNKSSPASTHSDNDILRHINEIEFRLANAPIHGLKKMSPDEGEKFFLDYWDFGPDSQGQLSRFSARIIFSLSLRSLPVFSAYHLCPSLGKQPIMSDKPQKPLPFVYQFAAGAVAGVSEILVMYPLDVVKTRVQLQSGAATAGAEHYNGMVDCFRKIIKQEGFKTLYRGISAPILMEAPKRATKFAANDSWGAFYRDLFKVEKQTQSLAVLTGATAGATESFVVVPFELVKIRLQDKASAGKYNGMLDVVKKIVQTEGPLAMYNGLESTLWRHILWNAGYFGCIFQIRAQLPTPEPGNKSQQTRNDLIAGSIGGIAGTLLNTPMDVVKSRIQNTTKVPGQTPKYNWAWPALGTVMKEEGFAALYKGFAPKVLRLGPGGGILLVVFTNVMDFFRKMRDE
ncbi:hypothetical protein N7451_004334 [Penicillium sp. IBT 35674x]|nr:hypothetical protein N7451_004334 [Penicillium sp. IBT 35674x]